MPDTSKKRRGSTKDDATLAFIDGRITVEGRIQRAGEFVTAIAQHGPAKTDPSKADLAPAETDSAKTDPPKTDLPGADPTKTDPTETNPAKNDSALLGQLSSHAGPSNGPPLRDGPEEMETNIAGPSPSRIETRAVASEEGKKENVRPELKRAKSSSKKKKSKFSSSNVIPSTDYPPPVPGAPETTPPKPEQIEAGVDGGVNKEIEESRASERDQRSGRPSTEADGRRAVHLFQEPTMIPGALPGARILSYTYPKLAPTTAHEYVDKAAQKLLESLISARSELPYNTAPIIFIGYGFGGIVLQKLLVLATDAPDEKKAASAQLLDMNAGFVFLNTPFPASKQGDSTDQPSFPSGFNARQEHIMRRLGEDGNKLDVRALWEKFDLKRVIEGQKLPIIWFHTLLAKDSSSASKVASRH
ncbi:hypothetical protein N431DRAFT_86747 [Stipitochalara longipes BDJ]|nr:hypothetical protein N431DRAFT_86747 [Stipitochalara longipes BDJ]